MHTVATAEDAARLCGAILGRPIESGRASGTGTVFFVELDEGETLIVKVVRPDRSASPIVEAWIYAECRRRGIRVPEVLGVSEDPEAIVMRSLPGVSLWQQPSSGAASVWREAGADLRAMHEVSVPGFGPLTRGAGGGVEGVSDRWSPVVDFARDEGVKGLADRGLLTMDEVHRLIRRYEEIEPLLAEVTQGQLLHGDLQAGHLYVDPDGSYLGVIDFDQSQAGDPRWDMARATLWDGEDALDLFLAGYGDNPFTRESRELLVPLYLLAFCIHHIVRFPFNTDPKFAELLLSQCNYQRLL